MIQRNLLLAIRVFFKHPLSSFITLIGLATGIGCFLVLALYVFDEYRTDRFHGNYDHIYHLDMKYYVDGEPMFNIPPPSGLFNDLAAIEGVELGSRAFSPRDVPVVVNQKKFIESGLIFVDSSWVEIFDFKYQNQSYNFLNDPSAIAISESMAKKYFNSLDVIGELIIVDKEAYTVGNIILDNEANSSLEINFLVAYQKRKTFGVDVDSYESGHTPYFIVSNGLDADNIRKNIQQVIDDKLGGMEVKIELTSLEEFYFQGSSNIKFQNAGIRGNKKFYQTFALIAILILLVAIINYVNLVTARATERSKEVGVKKTIGASRSGLIWQFQIESLFLTLSAGLVAVGIAELLLTYFNKLMIRPIDDSIMVSAPFLFGYLALLLVITTFSGFYPSLILSSFKPMSAIKQSNAKLGSKAWLRNTLTVVQFVITTLLIFGSAVIMKQMTFMTDFDLGFDSDQILSVDASQEMQKSVEVIKPDLLLIPGVEEVSVGNLPGIGWMYTGEFEGETVNVAIQQVDEDFFAMAGLSLLEGRALSTTDAGTTNTVVNKTMRDLLFGENATVFGKQKDSDMFLVGVVDDFEFSTAKSAVMPLELKMHKNEFRNILLRLSEGANVRQVISEMTGVFDKHVPDDIVNFSFLDDDYDRQFKAEELFLDLLGSFTALCIFIGSIGLFGLAQYSFIKNLKTIGIKKVLGAERATVVWDLLKGLFAPVLSALIVALPLGFYIMNNWLSDYANKIQLGGSLFAATVGVVILISLVTVLYQVIGALKLKPVHALRDD